jgi:glycosyltransferase involved in cell wall biosynthesis
MMSLPKEQQLPLILFIPRWQNGYAPEQDTQWRALRSLAEIATFQVPDDVYLLRGEKGGAELERCFDIAYPHLGKYDYVIGNLTSGFLWHIVFRLAGDKTPFVILPRFNHVSLRAAYAAFLSSQMLLPHDILFAGSSAASRSFARFGFRCDPLYPLGIDLAIFHPLSVNKTLLRSSLGLSDTADILLYAGRVECDKNILELLDIFEIVRQARLAELVVCYHFSNADYLSQCMKRAETIGNVRFVHDPDREVLAQYYNVADLFVSAAVSVHETFGRAPVEAMACGTPSIVSEYDGFRETINPECGVLVPTTRNGHKKWPDVHRFAQEILSVLNDKESLREKSRSCIGYAQRYQRNVSLQAMLAKLQSLPIERQAAVDLRIVEISLEHYPAEIRALFSPLKGRLLNELVRDFLLTLEVPVQPTITEKNNFYDRWFSHY